MHTKRNILRHPLFLLCLLLLVLNDHVLKQAYHNALTGKLSDFAGLFIFPIFWSSYFPKYKKTIYVLTALFFIYFKSSLSTPLLGIFEQLHIPITRVVDYTDLIALLILPFSYWFLNDAKPLQLRLIETWTVSIISFFAFCATSPPWDFMPCSTDCTYYKSFKTKLSKEDVLAQIDELGLSYSIDSVYIYGGWRTHTCIEVGTLANKHDSTGVRCIYWTIKNLKYNDEILPEVYIMYKEQKQYNYIQVYGYKLDDPSVLSGKVSTYKHLLHEYRRMIRNGLIEEIKE